MTEIESDKPKKAPTRDRISIMVDDERRELFMSFGLLNECTEIISDLPRVSMLPMDRNMRGQVLVSVLSKRDENGVIMEPYNPFTTEVSVEDVVAILTWVSEHVLDFFLKAITANMNAHRAHEGVLGLMASGNGLKG